MSRLNIGMILDNEFNGDLRVENEAKALQKAGYNVFVLCYNHGTRNKIDDFEGVKIIRISMSKTVKNKLKFINNTVFDIYSIFWKYKIKSFVKEYDINILHAHDLFMARSVILANRKLQLKTVLDLHENYPATLASYSWSKSFLGKLLVSPERWKKLEAKYLPKFTAIILLSEQFQKVIVDKYPQLQGKIYLYPNYPNVEHLLSFDVDEKIFDKKEKFVLFYFGGIAVRRGIFTLLDALKILVKKNKSYQVLLIGPVDKADRTRLNSYLHDPVIKENIIQYDWKDIKYLPSYINASDICVSPIIKNEQHESGIANKVFQYMLFKKPLIVSNCTPQQKVAEDEKCGLVFSSEDSNDLADKIEILYQNPELRKEMGINGNRAVLEKYNFIEAGKNLVNMYRSLENEVN
jgi:glycosyltransferase involved in cell wall biosynthesis